MFDIRPENADAVENMTIREYAEKLAGALNGAVPFEKRDEELLFSLAHDTLKVISLFLEKQLHNELPFTKPYDQETQDAGQQSWDEAETEASEILADLNSRQVIAPQAFRLGALITDAALHGMMDAVRPPRSQSDIMEQLARSLGIDPALLVGSGVGADLTDEDEQE